MAYGVKYRIQYKNFLGELQRIDILFKGYSGAIEQVKAGATPLSIENNKDMSGDYLGGLVLTKYTVQGISSATFQSAFFTSEEYGDTLIAKYSHTNTLEFYGIVLPFDCRDAFEAAGTYTVSIGAECGLSSLKTIEYREIEGFYIGRSKLIDIIYRCLNKLPYPTQFGLKSINNTKVYEGILEVNAATDFYQNYIYNETFQQTLYTYDNCYNVLKQAIGELSELSFSNGSWWIKNIPELGQAISYISTYSNAPDLLSRQLYDKTGKSVGKNGDLRALKGGQRSKQLSQNDVTIKTTPGFLINYLANPNFAQYQPIFGLVDWFDRSLFGSNVVNYEHGGSGTEADPYYYQFTDSVYTETFEGIDNQYIESAPIKFYPFGRFPDILGNYTYKEPENLLITGKAEIGSRVKALRMQLITIQKNVTPNKIYYYNQDGTWQETPAVYLLPLSDSKRKGEFTIELPSPVNFDPNTGDIPDFNQLIEYDFKIRLFRGERYDSYVNAEPTEYRSYYSRYFLINVNIRPSLFKESIEGKEETFITTRYSDRKSNKAIELKVGGAYYPYAYGSIFKDTETATPINNFAFFNDEFLNHEFLITTSACDYHTVKGYLRVLGNRLALYELDLIGKIAFSDIIVIDEKKFRIANLQYNDRLVQSKVKLIELTYNENIHPISKQFAALIAVPAQPVGVSEIIRSGKEKLKPKGDNFDYTIDDLGLSNFKLSDDLKLTSIIPRDNLLSLGNQESGTLTEVLGRFGVKSTNNFLGEFLIGENSEDRAYSFPDRDLEVNQWNDLSDVPESFPPDATYFKTDYGLVGVLDGINKVFETTESFVPGTIRVYVNGIRQFKGANADYQEVDENSIEFAIAPESDDRLIIDYIKFT